MMDQPVRRILVATDLSPNSDGLFPVAGAVGRQLNAKVIFLHLFKEADYVKVRLAAGKDVVGEPYRPIPRREFVANLRAQIRLWTWAVGLPPEQVWIEIRSGEAVADQILATAARTDADLILMGTHGRTGWSRMVLGSVAEAVLRRATIPLLIVPMPVLEARAREVAQGIPVG